MIESDTITRVCICGCTFFRVPVQFDEDYEISAYLLSGMECIECGSKWTAPTPLDLPEDHPNNPENNRY